MGIGVSEMLKFYVIVFYVMGKALSGELFCPCHRSCYSLVQCFIHRDIVLILMLVLILAWVLAFHFKVLRLSFICVLGKALSDELPLSPSFSVGVCVLKSF